MMRYRLFHSPGACSLAPHVLLEELGVAFEAERVSVHEGEQRRPEYLAINPRGRVPTLAYEVSGQTRYLTESVAILLFLARKHAEAGFLPDSVEQQARALEWLCWLGSTMHQTGFRMILRPQNFSADEGAAPGIKATARELVQNGYGDINTRLAGQEWALGSRYSIVDMALLVHYRWGNRAKFSMREDYPHFAALTDRVRQRPAVARVIAREGIEID